MKTGFPHKILWFAVGWQDRGDVNTIVNGKGNYTTDMHKYCFTILRIGIEGEKIFRFCPKCLVKTSYETKSKNN